MLCSLLFTKWWKICLYVYSSNSSENLHKVVFMSYELSGNVVFLNLSWSHQSSESDLHLHSVMFADGFVTSLFQLENPSRCPSWRTRVQTWWRCTTPCTSTLSPRCSISTRHASAWMSPTSSSFTEEEEEEEEADDDEGEEQRDKGEGVFPQKQPNPESFSTTQTHTTETITAVFQSSPLPFCFVTSSWLSPKTLKTCFQGQTLYFWWQNKSLLPHEALSVIHGLDLHIRSWLAVRSDDVVTHSPNQISQDLTKNGAKLSTHSGSGSFSCLNRLKWLYKIYRSVRFCFVILLY